MAVNTRLGRICTFIPVPVIYALRNVLPMPITMADLPLKCSHGSHGQHQSDGADGGGQVFMHLFILTIATHHDPCLEHLTFARGGKLVLRKHRGPDDRFTLSHGTIRDQHLMSTKLAHHLLKLYL